jgi:hypothetical protein
METVRLSYRELAERLGVKPESARKTAQRKRWKRDVANDGTARVHVPVELLPVPGDVARDVPPDVTRDVPPDHARELEIRIEGLRMLLQAESRRADAAEADRDRWHAMACRPWWRRLAG